MSRVITQLLFTSCCVLAGEAAHDDHASGSSSFEWAGLFAVSADLLQWTAQKQAIGGYAQAHMKVAILPATDGTSESLHALEAEGNHALNMTCQEVDAGETMVPQEDRCYELHFEDAVWQSLFAINTSGLTHVAIFTEHDPTEFERGDTHFLKVLATGAHMEPEHSLPENGGHNHDSHPPALPPAASCTSSAFEWGAIFAVPKHEYIWTAQVKAGATAYAQSKMAIVLLPATDDAEATLHGLEDDAVDGFGHTPCTKVEPGGTIVPKTHTCFELHFAGAGDTSTSTFTIDADSTHLAIFTQHDPAEFERDTHYLTVPHGDHADAVDAAHVLACGAGGAAAPTGDAGDDESLPWGEVIASTLTTYHSLLTHSQLTTRCLLPTTHHLLPAVR